MAAYVVAQIDVHDTDGMQLYKDKVPATIERYGGRYLVRGGDTKLLEGDAPASRIVIIEFPSREAAETWYVSPDYQAVLPLRLQAASGSAMIVDGVS